MSAIIAPVPASRRRVDTIMRASLLVGTLIALVPLVLVVYYLLKQGLGALSWDFFTTDPTGRFLGPPGGVKSAIVGTILIVALASAIAIPAGVGVALYLVEYGRTAIRIISQRVAPSASAASFCASGTVAMTSREIAETIGRIMIARIRPAMK